jgi:hypothetical protein
MTEADLSKVELGAVGGGMITTASLPRCKPLSVLKISGARMDGWQPFGGSAKNSPFDAR